MVLLGAFELLLSRYAGVSDIVIGAPIAGRSRSETHQSMGYFVNTLALRVDLSNLSSIDDLLSRVRKACLDGYANADVPFQDVVDALKIERDPSYSPVFQTMFTLLDDGADSGSTLDSWGGVCLRDDAAVSWTTSKFDIDLTILQDGDDLIASFEYSTALFDGTTIEFMGRHFVALLHSMSADTLGPVAALSLLDADELNLVTKAWNATTASYPDGKCIHEFLIEQAEKTPDAIALCGNGRSMTYQDVDLLASLLARQLASLGVGPDSLVGVFMRCRMSAIVAIHGILRAGGAYVPIEPSFPADRVRFIIDDSQMCAIVTETHLQDLLPAFQGSLDIILYDQVLQTALVQPRPSRVTIDSGVQPHNLAYVIYTSGTTGRPKGVLVEHRGLVNDIWYVVPKMIPPEDFGMTLFSTSVCFDQSVTEVFAPHMLGGCLCVA